MYDSSEYYVTEKMDMSRDEYHEMIKSSGNPKRERRGSHGRRWSSWEIFPGSDEMR